MRPLWLRYQRGQATRMRITRLDADGKPMKGPENSYETDGLVTVTMGPYADDLTRPMCGALGEVEIL